jgi:hypothetical protein
VRDELSVAYAGGHCDMAIAIAIDVGLEQRRGVSVRSFGNGVGTLSEKKWYATVN